jgi:hypothetical protein
MRARWGLVTLVVASGLAALGQQPPEPADVLRRTQQHLLPDLARLPRYTCVQTITRKYFRAPFSHPRSCAGMIQAHDERTGELKSTGWDRLRLEVAIAEGQNVFSWVGAARFEDDNLEELAGRGPLGSGDFGSFLESVLSRATIGFKGEKAIHGRRLLEYSYDMPVSKSGYLVRTRTEWVPTAYHGTLLLDPGTADVAALTVRTAELPDSNPACQANSEVEYQRTAIHDRMVLVPKETRLNTLDREGSEAVSVTTYQSCREYSTKSRMLAVAPSHDAPGPGATGPPAPAPEPPASPISPDLRFDCRIITPINSDTAAAGDPVEGVLRSAINDKKNGFQIPVGARVRGRLVRFEQRSGMLDSFRIAVQWESIEVKGKPVPLRAIPEFLAGTGAVFVITDDTSPGGRTLVFHDERLRLQRFDWKWVTLAPGSAAKIGETGSDSGGIPTSRSVSAVMPRTVEIADSEFPIEAASGLNLKFSVPAGAKSVRLEGTFKPTGGSNDVAVFLFSEEEFVKGQSNQPASALYESGRTQSGTIDVALPPGAGTYFVVFSNNFPLSTPKVVQASLRLHFSL